jgi:WD40 repeat protein
VLILQAPDHPVQALTFSPDSTALYVVQGYHGIRAWNLAERTATRVEYGGRLLVGHFVFHPAGRWAFSSTAHTTPADPTPGRVIDVPTGTMRPFNCALSGRDNIALFPGAERLVTIGPGWCDTERLANPVHRYSGRLYGWTLTSVGPAYAWHRDEPLGESFLFVVALGDQFALAESIGPADDPDDDDPVPGERRSVRIAIRRLSDGERTRELLFPHSEIQQLLASPRGDLLVGRYGTELHIWDATDRTKPEVALAGHRLYTLDMSAAAAFHPSGRYFLLANDTPVVTAFDTATWRPAHRWDWKAGPLRSVAVSPDGTLAAAGGANGAVVVWDWDL